MDDIDFEFIPYRAVPYGLLRDAMRNELISRFGVPQSILSATIHQDPETIRAEQEQAFKKDILTPYLQRIND